jgi:hypothetical protein
VQTYPYAKNDMLDSSMFLRCHRRSPGIGRGVVFERYNITDQSDTLEAGRLAEEFLSRAPTRTRHKRRRKTRGQTE